MARDLIVDSNARSRSRTTSPLDIGIRVSKREVNELRVPKATSGGILGLVLVAVGRIVIDALPLLATNETSGHG